jgi:hypothetical protein
VITVVLASTFLWSGTAKLRDPKRTALALVDFDVLATLRPRVGTALACGELVVGSALIVALGVEALRAPAALAAAIACLAFATVTARSLHRGATFACFCFGEDDSRLSRWTLLRSLGLLALAGVVAGAPSGPASEPRGTVAAVVVVAAALGGLFVLLRAAGRLRRWNRDPLGLDDALWIAREDA